jgi:hypothetical protein
VNHEADATELSDPTYQPHLPHPTHLAYDALAIAAAIAAFVVGVRWGTQAAGGSDSSCYMNEARLFSRFTTHIDAPLAASAPWPRAAWTFTPAGHLPSPARAGAIVPMCPPGLPIVMAIARWVHADLLVVPLLGALAVWLTYMLGREIDGPLTGAASAVLMACSPIFLYQVVQPMTDVPAAAWWLLAAVLVSDVSDVSDTSEVSEVSDVSDTWGALAAGLAASMAILTRPNLLPLALIVAIYLGRRSVAPFFVGLVPGIVVLALLNWRMYGSPVASGYGAASDLFQLANIVPNLQRYGRWLWQTHTPVLALAIAAPFLVPRRAPAWLALALASATIALYLPYRVFDDWWYLRFLLPAIPLLVVLSIATIRQLADRALPQASNRGARENRRASFFSAFSAVPVGLIVVVLGAWWIQTARTGHAFDLRDWERHFIDAGRFAADRLPPNAAVLTVKHSGSVHYYAGRPIVAWDTLDPASLDRTLTFLREHGLVPMLLLDTEEEPVFRARFGAASEIGRLDWPPIARPARTVRAYDPADRAGYWSQNPRR